MTNPVFFLCGDVKIGTHSPHPLPGFFTWSPSTTAPARSDPPNPLSSVK